MAAAPRWSLSLTGMMVGPACGRLSLAARALVAAALWGGVVVAPVVLARQAQAQESVVNPPNLPGPRDRVMDRSAWVKLNGTADSIMANIMAENNWNTEQDQLFIQMHEKLKRTRPFDINARLDVVLNTLGDRYNLRDDQKAKIKQIAVREGMSYAFRNSSQMRGILDTITKDRLWEQNITQDTVKKYVDLYRPLMDAGTEAIERAKGQIANVLDDEQKKLLEQDWSLTQSRLQVTRETMDRWGSGDWQPTDWGLNDDGTMPADGSGNAKLLARLQVPPTADQPPQQVTQQVAQAEVPNPEFQTVEVVKSQQIVEGRMIDRSADMANVELADRLRAEAKAAEARAAEQGELEKARVAEEHARALAEAQSLQAEQVAQMQAQMQEQGQAADQEQLPPDSGMAMAAAVPPQPPAEQPAPMVEQAPAAPAVPIPQLGQWTKFVEDYIQYYQLSPEVAGNARTILADVVSRAGPVNDRVERMRARWQARLKRDDLVGKRREYAEAQLAAVTQPVDDLFRELVRRLDRLLNGSQARKPPMPGRPDLSAPRRKPMPELEDTLIPTQGKGIIQIRG